MQNLVYFKQSFIHSFVGSLLPLLFGLPQVISVIASGVVRCLSPSTLGFMNDIVVIFVIVAHGNGVCIYVCVCMNACLHTYTYPYAASNFYCACISHPYYVCAAVCVCVCKCALVRAFQNFVDVSAKPCGNICCAHTLTHIRILNFREFLTIVTIVPT